VRLAKVVKRGREGQATALAPSQSSLCHCSTPPEPSSPQTPPPPPDTPVCFFAHTPAELRQPGQQGATLSAAALAAVLAHNEGIGAASSGGGAAVAGAAAALAAKPASPPLPAARLPAAGVASPPQALAASGSWLAAGAASPPPAAPQPVALAEAQHSPGAGAALYGALPDAVLQRASAAAAAARALPGLQLQPHLQGHAPALAAMHGAGIAVGHSMLQAPHQPQPHLQPHPQLQQQQVYVITSGAGQAPGPQAVPLAINGGLAEPPGPQLWALALAAAPAQAPPPLPQLQPQLVLVSGSHAPVEGGAALQCVPSPTAQLWEVDAAAAPCAPSRPTVPQAPVMLMAQPGAPPLHLGPMGQAGLQAAPGQQPPLYLQAPGPALPAGALAAPAAGWASPTAASSWEALLAAHGLPPQPQ
jgi:hypothetical protein